MIGVAWEPDRWSSMYIVGEENTSHTTATLRCEYGTDDRHAAPFSRTLAQMENQRKKLDKQNTCRKRWRRTRWMNSAEHWWSFACIARTPGATNCQSHSTSTNTKLRTLNGAQTHKLEMPTNRELKRRIETNEMTRAGNALWNDIRHTNDFMCTLHTRNCIMYRRVCAEDSNNSGRPVDSFRTRSSLLCVCLFPSNRVSCVVCPIGNDEILSPCD